MSWAPLDREGVRRVLDDMGRANGIIYAQDGVGRSTSDVAKALREYIEKIEARTLRDIAEALRHVGRIIESGQPP